MEALRTIYKIENNFLNISIPLDFKSTHVEVIILPYNNREELETAKTEKKNEITDFQKLLLTAPVMSDEDFEYYQEKRNQFNRWK